MDITRWSILKSDWLYFLHLKMEKPYTVSKNKTGADCNSDHQLLIAKFRLELKTVRKTTRLFSYDLNQISYDYTVEVRNRFKELDLVWQSAWRTMDGGSYRCTGCGDQKHLQEKEMQEGKKAKWLSEEALQIGKWREAKGKGEKERYTHLGKVFN